LSAGRRDDHPERPGTAVSRRRVLTFLGAGGAGYVLSRLVPLRYLRALGDAIARQDTPLTESVTTHSRGPVGSLERWSDAATWGGPVPGHATRVVVSGPVLLDVDAEVAHLEIADGGSLVFDPLASRTLGVRGGVVVHGQLQMRPSSGEVLHQLVLLDADEGRYQGESDTVLETDPGLWVMNDGVLDVAGAPKLAWTRAAESIPGGAKRILLSEEPTGWRVGDTVILTPTQPPGAGHHEAYDEAAITAVSGRTVSLSRPTRYAHPAVDVGNGRRLGGEILNLTRNVQIEGTPEGRVHVFLHGHRSQTIRWAAIRYVGPRKGGEGVVGRYGLHFHAPADTARGCLVEGVVVRDAGNHAFVPHATQDATFRECISHHTIEEAYWWDAGSGNQSHGTLYDRCVASDVRAGDNDRGFRLTGFWLGHGDSNYARDCVAVGVGGDRRACGFLWPEAPHRARGQRADKRNQPKESGSWTLENCVAHNNRFNGIFVWQNNSQLNAIDGFVGYHNGRAGIEHGAYRNRFQYRDSTLYGNGAAAIILHATAGPPPPRQAFIRVRCDGAGLSDYLVATETHSLPAVAPTEFRECSFRGAREAAFGVVHERPRNPDVLDVIDCAFEGNEIWFSSDIHPDTVFRVQDARRGSLEVRRADQTGSYEARWNARVTHITPFDPHNPG
jgi:hypothetical protein